MMFEIIRGRVGGMGGYEGVMLNKNHSFSQQPIKAFEHSSSGSHSKKNLFLGIEGVLGV